MFGLDTRAAGRFLDFVEFAFSISGLTPDKYELGGQRTRRGGTREGNT